MRPVDGNRDPGQAPLQDLIVYLQLWVMTLSTWFLILGWRAGEFLTRGDGLEIDLPYLIEFIKAGGKWRNLLYRTDWLGGTKISTIGGIPWTYQFFSYLGLAPHWSINLSIFFVQTAFSYFGFKILQELYVSTRNESLKLHLLSTVLLNWIIGFAPVLALQIESGHWLMISGTLFTLGAITLIMESRNKVPSLVSCCIFSGISLLCFTTALQQPVLYGILFGSPLFISLCYPYSRIKNGITFVGLIALGSLGFFGEYFYTLVSTALQSDGTRNLLDTSVVYSYLTATWDDVISSLFWGFKLFDSGREPIMLHEVSFPMGPPLVFLALLWKVRKHSWIIGILTSFGLAWTFSANFEPISELLLTLIPILNAFRVPTRSLLLPTLSLPILAISSLFITSGPNLGRIRYPLQKEDRMILLTVLSALFIFSLPAQWREAFLWLCCIGFVSHSLISKKEGIVNRIFPTFILTLLAVGSLGSFKERLSPRTSITQIETLRDDFKASIASNTLELVSPLDRIYDQYSNEFLRSNNFSKIAGYSILNGYTFPLRRFSTLVKTLDYEDYSPVIINFFSYNLDRSMKVLQKLYNVKYRLGGISNTTTRNQIEIEKYPPPLGPAWFSTKLVQVDSIAELRNLLIQEQDSNMQLQERSPILRSDPVILEGVYPPSFYLDNEACRQSLVRDVTVGPYQNLFTVHVQNSGDCHLTLSTNYVREMQAVGKQTGKPEQELKIYPTYGALTGVWVPAGIDTIQIKIQLNTPTLLPGLSWVVFLGSLFLFLYKRRIELLKSI